MMKNKITSMVEEIFGQSSTSMFWAWMSAIALVVVVGLYVGSETVSFLGIAESREININFERAVEIKTVHVQAGQRVNKGDILLELSQGEIETELRTLRAQVTKIDAELKLRESLSRIVSKRKVVDSTNVIDPLKVDRSQLLREIGLLENQKRALFVFADIDGIVGAVNFKAGEKAPSFASLLTISSVNPSYVIGYVHESSHSKLERGQKVSIISPASGKQVVGEVMTVGSRIVELPVRLLRIPTISSWGREVMIKMPEENGFLLSEKVQVKPMWTLDFMPSAEANPVQQPGAEEIDVILPYELSLGKTFEPSGLVWAEDLGNYIVVSDESLQPGSPVLLMMNDKGQVSRQLLTVDGAGSIDDMESISADGTNLYVMASQSSNKKGNRTAAREVFLKIERRGLVLKTVGQISLRTMLEEALASTTDARLSAIAAAVSLGDIDVEGHAVENGDLFLALKSPQPRRSVGTILRVKNVESLFQGASLDSASVSIHAEIELSTQKQDMQLSDLYMKDGKGFVATTCQHSKCSAVFSFSAVAGVKPVQLGFFKKEQLEGISYDAKSNVLTGIFDDGGKPTRIVKIQLK